MSTTIAIHNRYAEDTIETVQAHTVTPQWAIVKTKYGWKIYHRATGLSCPVGAPWNRANGWANDPRLKDAKRALELVQTLPDMADTLTPVWGRMSSEPASRAWLSSLADLLKIQKAEQELAAIDAGKGA